MKRRLFLQQSSVLGAGLMASSLSVANNNESSVFTPESLQPVDLVNPAMGSAKSRWFYFH